MDEHISPFSLSQSSLLSFTSAPSSSSTLLMFPSSDISEQWFFPDTGVTTDTRNDDEATGLLQKPEYATTLSPDTEHPRILPGHPATAAPPPVPKRSAGRKAARGSSRPAATNHVENERQRREKMNRCFCQLRAAVPTVSRMDKASLLADATGYIHQLRARVAQLEAQARQQEAGAAAASQAAAVAGEEMVDVRMVGTEMAVVRVVTGAQHAPASLMGALRALHLQVRHACMSRAHGMITEDVVVDVPPGASALRDGLGLRTALLEKMQGSG